MTEDRLLEVGTKRTITYLVGEDNMVHRLLPGVAEFTRKPEVMATGWLVGVCEWPAMEALRDYMTETQCSLGTGVAISHLAPVPPGATLRVTAECIRVEKAHSEWAVHARDDSELVATGTAKFVVVDLNKFVRQKLTPKKELLASA